MPTSSTATDNTISNTASGAPAALTDQLIMERGTTGYKLLVSDIAKAVVELYSGSSLAGASQSVKAALDSLNSSQAGIKTVFKGTVSSESPVQIQAYTAHTIFLVAIGTWTNSRLLAAFPNNSGEPIVRVICAKQNVPEDIYSVTANGQWGLTISTTSTSATPLTVIAIIKST